MARYSESMSPETISSMFPDRPIHPLPKRRLRERLSPEAAESIEYPPTPPATVFYYPYNSAKDDDSDAHKASSRVRGAANGGLARGLESEEEDPSRVRRSLVPRSAPSILGRPLRASPKAGQTRQGHAQAPPSAASSVDGYDTFENTNNKKKRKVPDTALGGHSLNDLSVGSGQMSPSTPSRAVHGETCGANCSSFHGMGSSSPGLSGPGRGRFGRNRSGRSPLSEGSRNSKVRPVRWPLSVPNPGIISNAIAKVEKIPSQQGQENVSLLQMQQDPKSSTVSGQFTFTCDTQVPGTISWPGSLAKAPGMASHGASASGHTTSKPTKPAWPGGTAHGGPSGPSGGPRPGGVAPQATTQKKTRRRSRVDEYAKAAAERKRSTQVQNLHHPPKEEEMWICHFCEYEYIFGEKPEALIRQYEIKDRKKRKEEEERRRLLEKAKARGRKGKKGAKAPARTSGAGQDRGHAPDQQGHGHEHSQGHDQDYEGQRTTPIPDDDGESQGNKSSNDVGEEFEGDGAAGDGLGQAKPPDTSTGRRFGTRAGRVGSTSGAGGGGPSMVGRPVKV
ncbi:hypothetical protein, variant 1 [Gaeumannomyces tritici R3-111a-1]|uniref:Uncharacterized protein n=1 Tax=Gaeumannomyces tritici (strain R3-111a-1) TaxID=644352 RepID=J3PD28_GAET3|nr:hypothetical protein, variant 1 [Gaeumannomyces tritici R3-111a-1]EJT70373.1 hypothetical protein, variant 1 [Gaeumannomyces tritici R3-111a-1]